MERKINLEMVNERIELSHTNQNVTWYPIDYYPWGGDYRPTAQGSIRLVDGKGFYVKMCCFEKDRQKTHKEPNSPVYEDSCMECFVNFYPEESEKYLNFEVNAGGIMLAQWGIGKTERISIQELGLDLPQVKLTETSELWAIQYMIPLNFLKVLYGKCNITKGDMIACNFYKCGDMTPHPHYGCSAPINWEVPNFHLPQFFEKIIL